MDISVVIPTYRSQFLEETLKSLHNQKTEYRYEIIVIQNPKHTEIVEDLCEKYGAMHLVLNGIGANHARNTGINIAQSELIGIIDDDVVVENDWIERAIKVTNLFPKMGVLGGKVSLKFQDGQPRWFEGIFRKMLSEFSGPIGISEIDSSKSHIVSANMVFTKANWRKVGGLDARIGYSGDNLTGNDEVDFQKKLGVLGAPGILYDSELKASHIIPKFRTELPYLKKRFYGQGLADSLQCTESILDVFHNRVQHEAIHFMDYEETLKIREKICDENYTREYIKNYIICRTAYLAGLTDGLTNTNLLDFEDTI